MTSKDLKYSHKWSIKNDNPLFIALSCCSKPV